MRRRLFAVCLMLALGAPAWSQSWSKYSNVAGKFSVLLPGTPAERIKPSRVGPVHSFGVSQPTQLFVVTYADFPESELKQSSSTRLAESKEDFVSTYHCKLISEHEFKFQHTGMDLPALDFNCELGNTTFTVRTILNGRRVYGLAAGIKNSASSDNVQRFLNSFSVN